MTRRRFCSDEEGNLVSGAVGSVGQSVPRRAVDRRGGPEVRELPDVMSASEGGRGHGKLDVVREVV